MKYIKSHYCHFSTLCKRKYCPLCPNIGDAMIEHNSAALPRPSTVLASVPSMLLLLLLAAAGCLGSTIQTTVGQSVRLSCPDTEAEHCRAPPLCTWTGTLCFCDILFIIIQTPNTKYLNLNTESCCSMHRTSSVGRPGRRHRVQQQPGGPRQSGVRGRPVRNV